jgi:hypothetical protein
MTFTDKQVVRISAVVETFAELYKTEGRFCFDKSTLPDLNTPDVYQAVRNLLFKRHELLVIDLLSEDEFAICTLQDLRDAGAILVTEEEFRSVAETLGIDKPDELTQYLVNKVDNSKLH